MEKGFKVFNPDWTCRDYQYEVGKTFEMEETPILCKVGFHYCTRLVDCFNYYDFNPNNKVAEIEALGDIVGGEDKHCTNKIKIVRELSWCEVLKMTNIGVENTGYRNSGDYNSGDYNSGDCNSGNCNSGNRNSGNRNSGNYNSGDRNSGNRNSGNYNSGDRNSGNCNSGNRNSGNCNSGNRNSGDYNSGDYNSGDCNSGYCNSGNYNSGAFNTEKNPKIKLFDKESNMTYEEFLNSDAREILSYCPYEHSTFVTEFEMTNEEKEKHSEYETAGGYVKVVKVTREDRQKWWDNLSTEEKEIVKSLPNFDSEKFCECMNIDHI